jgi:hypothetical protein
LDQALAWIVLNAVRAFHQTTADDITGAEERFLKIWREIPAERRQAALDFELPNVGLIGRLRAQYAEALRE